MAAHAAIHDFLRENNDMDTGIRRHDDGRAASRESSFMQAGMTNQVLEVSYEADSLSVRRYQLPAI